MLSVCWILHSKIELLEFQPGALDRVLVIERHSFGRDAWTKKLFLHYFRRWPDLFLIANIGRRVVGYVLTSVEGRKAEVGSIAVDPRDRRKGVGEALLHETLERLRSRGVQKCELMVEVINVASVHLYEKLGFVRRGKLKSYYGRGRDAWRMQLKNFRATIASRRKEPTTAS